MILEIWSEITQMQEYVRLTNNNIEGTSKIWNRNPISNN